MRRRIFKIMKMWKNNKKDHVIGMYVPEETHTCIHIEQEISKINIDDNSYHEHKCEICNKWYEWKYADDNSLPIRKDPYKPWESNIKIDIIIRKIIQSMSNKDFIESKKILIDNNEGILSINKRTNREFLISFDREKGSMIMSSGDYYKVFEKISIIMEDLGQVILKEIKNFESDISTWMEVKRGIDFGT